MEINDRQLDEILADFSALGWPTYLDDPILGFGHAVLDRDDIGIPQFSPDLPRVPAVLVECHQVLWTHPDNPTLRQEVWTEHALAQGMQRIGPRGVRRLPNLDGWLLGEWPRDGGGFQLQSLLSRALSLAPHEHDRQSWNRCDVLHSTMHEIVRELNFKMI